MCLKFPEFEAGCAYKLVAYKKKPCIYLFIFAQISLCLSNGFLQFQPLLSRLFRRWRVTCTVPSSCLCWKCADIWACSGRGSRESPKDAPSSFDSTNFASSTLNRFPSSETFPFWIERTSASCWKSSELFRRLNECSDLLKWITTWFLNCNDNCSVFFYQKFNPCCRRPIVPRPKNVSVEKWKEPDTHLCIVTTQLIFSAQRGDTKLAQLGENFSYRSRFLLRSLSLSRCFSVSISPLLSSARTP